ncbi:Ribonuclease H [Parasponia andersonii]|uniref:Ribonuclease H n=1 Tax=Parasponia andersonii TaxID=3476 RepID=A0A2P5BKE0_PARAD|nr:Ribonuclease H [Parasponia andersonii]
MAITLVWHTIGESYNVGSGTIRNSLKELGILKCLNIKLKPSKAPKIVEVFWQVPLVGWLKINIDGAAYGCPGLAGYGGIFRISRGFFKRGFAISISKAYAFEAELAAVIHAIFYAWDLGWKNLWLESDSAYLVSILKFSSLSIP